MGLISLVGTFDYFALSGLVSFENTFRPRALPWAVLFSTLRAAPRYLIENVRQVVTTEELAYIAQDRKQYARRIRELRTEQGYAIVTRFTGRPDLRMGEYVLENIERVAEPHDRKIPFEIQKKVYKRAGSTCELCGWTRDRWTREDPRILELHHVAEHATGGPNTPENLVVLCSRCHDDVHAGRRELPPNIIG
ncbi:MAG: HNH endonuclease [Phycisphaerae bacterium]|nr:HNH endonuclease [Phycisphaerae bacterium]